ncbi:MAG: hypothetical protein JST70_14000 [Bacteroidetes bacterium]|nr:hypothetical protein [Bacteroidota bacterium]
MKYISICLLFIFFSCVGQNKPVNNAEERTRVTQQPLSKVDSMYEKTVPEEIQKLGIQILYDKTKWYLYSITCMRKLRFEPNAEYTDTNLKMRIPVDTNITYGMLPMRLESVNISNDSIEVHMRFYYNDILISEDIVANVPQAWGCVYQNRTDDEIVAVAGRGDIRYWKRGCKSPNDCIPFENSIKIAEIRQYLLANKSKADPWFYQEAIKRGVIKE